MMKFLDRCIESIALTLFLLYIHLADMAVRGDWLLPYLLASGIGIAATVYIWCRGIILNRLFLGITLYFCSGVASLLIGWDWLNQHYGELGAVAMLGWILAVGLISSLTSPRGFLGVSTPGYFSLKGGSMLLMFACVIASITAVGFMDNALLGQWLPFIFLFSMRSLLQHLDKKMLNAPVAA